MPKLLPLRWLSAALLALLVSLGAVTASTACAMTGPTELSAAAAAGGDCDEERSGAESCAKHCAVLCRAAPPVAPSLAARISHAHVHYFTRPAMGESLAPLPEQPPPR